MNDREELAEMVLKALQVGVDDRESWTRYSGAETYRTVLQALEDVLRVAQKALHRPDWMNEDD